MLRLTYSVAALAFMSVLALPLVGCQGASKDEDVPLIAAMKFVKGRRARPGWVGKVST
jgi:hypothetical protein